MRGNRLENVWELVNLGYDIELKVEELPLLSSVYELVYCSFVRYFSIIKYLHNGKLYESAQSSFGILGRAGKSSIK